MMRVPERLIPTRHGSGLFIAEEDVVVDAPPLHTSQHVSYDVYAGRGVAITLRATGSDAIVGPGCDGASQVRIYGRASIIGMPDGYHIVGQFEKCEGSEQAPEEQPTVAEVSAEPVEDVATSPIEGSPVDQFVQRLATCDSEDEIESIMQEAAAAEHFDAGDLESIEDAAFNARMLLTESTEAATT